MPYGDGILESPADRYGKTTLCMRNAKRLFKCAAYMVYFVGVLVFAVASKGSFLLMTQSLGNRLQEKQYASRWSFMLVATICVPYVFLFLEALAKSLFRNRRGPVFTDLITIFLLESIHTFGVCLLVFRVLPSCDVIRGLLLMNAVCTIPAFCKLTLSKSNSRPMLRFLTLFIDLAAFVAQCSVYFVVTSTQYTAFLTKPLTPTTTTQTTHVGESLSSDTFDTLNTALSNSIKATTDTIEQVRIRFGWEAPVALFCVSIVWWENYVDRDIKLGKLNIPLGTYKRHLQSVRSKANIGASIWKIALTVAFSFLLLPKERFENVFVSFNSNPTNNIPNDPSLHTGSDFNNYDAGSLSNQFDMNTNNDLPVRHKRQMPLFPTDDNNTIMGKIGGNADQMSLFPGNDDDPNIAADPFDFQPDREKTIDDYWHSIGPFVPMIIHFFSTGLCYYFSKSACKMQMQRVAFAVPLTLATPVTLAIMIGLCQWKTDQIVFIREIMYWDCSENLNTTRITWHIIIGLCLWYLSQLWITSHIWFPENKRLATTETLFVLPQYDSSLIEQSLLLNRRRNEPEHQKNKLEEHFEDLDIIDGMAAFSEDEKLENNTKIYLCGTLWHETISEMILMLKSIMRMDIDQSARRQARDEFQVIDPDYYDMEAHVFFDDAFYHDENQQRTLNMFVKDFFEAINKAAGIVHDVEGMKLAPPQKAATPYGGRLSWRLPGGNLLVVHLKDKLKVSKKKRWSMVMYMYYLLGYRILGQCEQRMKSLIKLIEDAPDKRNYRRHFDQNEDLHVYYKDILGPRLLLEAENTFILSVDGDVDFGPDSVRMLIDRMKKDKKVGAVSSRIHPIGSGPLIWYQKMEYAMCYWLQKTTEHSLGCVLCAPGCFALYRASALMDDNVMKVFAARCESPEDYLLKDLGEDRFLSKLLIEQGYRIEYCAAADAYTHAPETFTDFFNQRRRWIPSTLGITVSILKNYRRTIRINESVSFLAVLYHVFYLALYILSPATITIAIADAFNATTDIDVWAAYTLACFPAVAFLMICYHDITEEKKIICAAIFGTYYAIVMMIVVVGTIVRMVDGSWKTTAVFFLLFMGIIFFFTAICHPYELNCVQPCLLFFLCVPTSYVLLVIYALTNLNANAWGTREDIFIPNRKKKQKFKSQAECLQFLEQQFSNAKNSNELLAVVENLIDECHSQRTESSDQLLAQITAVLNRINMFDDLDKRLNKGLDLHGLGLEELVEEQEKKDQNQNINHEQKHNEQLINKYDDRINPYWFDHQLVKYADVKYLNENEFIFWRRLIQKYLKPIHMDALEKQKLQLGLNDLRDQGVFAFFMLDALWIAFVFSVLLAQNRLKDMLFIPVPIPSSYNDHAMIEPLGVMLIFFFGIICLIQFIAMLCHRYNTFQHILASTKLRSSKFEGVRIEDIMDIVKMLQQIKPIDEENEPLPDYSDGEMDKNDNPHNGMKGGDDDDRSQAGSGDDDVFVQAAAIAGEINNESAAGKYHIVDEKGPRKIRQRVSRRNHGKTTDDRHHRKGVDNPSFQPDESQHGIERITSPKRNRKIRSSASPTKKSRNAKPRTHSENRHLNSHIRSPQQQDTSILTTTQAGASAIYPSSSRHQRRTHYNKKLQKKNSLDANFRRRVEKLKEATSSTELDMKLLDKKMTKVLFNMHGVPVGPNVL
ncbi:unnamed protein product [Rotaria sp. Silwood1]|nr:unnamed protein product [Rotaria sp. Silwood1]CAF0739541.1 unnamed protein product [Rotaria sp. Silwood1]CAF0794548.1 unnamed protein product [Rotaria sp. Silwood1]CAF4584079.1 unnamed protein product [Rotaria sp. Silwood1]